VIVIVPPGVTKIGVRFANKFTLANTLYVYLLTGFFNFFVSELVCCFKIITKVEQTVRGRNLGSYPQIRRFNSNQFALFKNYFNMLISHYFTSCAPSLNIAKMNFFQEELFWSNFYLFYIINFIYLILLVVILFYRINNILYNYKASLKYKFLNWYVSGALISNIVFYMFSYVLLLILIIYGPISSLWYSHLIVDNLQFKINLAVIFLFLLILYLLNLNIVYISTNIYDFLIVFINLFFWIYLLFYANNLFTIIFFFEILAVLIMLLSSSSLFYNNLYLKKINFFNNLYTSNNLPFYQVASLIYFFWISFISSVNLFFYLLFFIYYFNTIDLFFLEFVVNYLKIFFNLFDFITYFFIWFGFIFCIFLKCGLVPFFIWKPNFFKGLSYIYLYIYITFYYFFLFIFLLLFFIYYFLELFNLFIYINLIILVIGLLMLVSLLFNLTYVKSFFAISSILNTLFIFITLLSFNYTNLIYIY
jgi:hypothetical protein